MATQPPLAHIHATAVAYSGAGCLILGKSGSGKSRLAAEMIQLGARLVADDQVILTVQSGMLMASAPKELANVLELRGIGLIRLPDIVPRHVLHLAIELDPDAEDRLPEPQTATIEGLSIPLLRLKPPPITGAGSVMLAIKAVQEGRMLPPDWRPVAEKTA